MGGGGAMYGCEYRLFRYFWLGLPFFSEGTAPDGRSEHCSTFFILFAFLIGLRGSIEPSVGSFHPRHAPWGLDTLRVCVPHSIFVVSLFCRLLARWLFY